MTSMTIRVEPAPGALQKALDSLPDNGVPVTVRLAPGIYRERVVIRRPDTTLEGEDAAVTRITADCGGKDLLPDGSRCGTFRTATLRTDAPRITLRRPTVENGAWPREKRGQAIALYADGDAFLCEDCVLLSWQDTLFTAPLPPREIEPGGFIGPKQYAPRTLQRHCYRRCTIRGDVDFIFGGAAAWFEDCTILTEDGREDRKEPFVGYCTAASTPQGQALGYVFRRCRFGCRGEIPPGSTYLGRPWREYAKTMLIDCSWEAHIHPALWHDWGKPAFHRLGDYAQTNACGAAAPFARMLSAEEARTITWEYFRERALDGAEEISVPRP